jgi:class 3 adenylate cyclase
MKMEKTAYAAKAGYYSTMILLTRILGIGVVILFLIMLLPLAIPYVKNAASYKYIKVALSIDKSMYSFIHTAIPTKVAGRDITRLIMLVGAVFLGIGISGIKQHLKNRLANLKVKMDYEEWKERMNVSDNAEVLTPLKGKLEKLKTSNKKDREELLKLFAETKRKLDSMGRDLAFLAIDIVDSTGIKVDEEKAAIEHDFMEYKRFVGSKLISNGALKTAWTPDGVMICFSNIDAAVRAARDIITGLDAFNKNVKTLQQDFKVRCGINQGYVHFDESVPLEEISDRVIDIAGHMQKQAKPNTICIAKPAVEPLQEKNGFVPAGKVVDGYEVYIWEKP